MTSLSPEESAQLQKSIALETVKFQDYFLWLREAMPARFHEEVTEKELSLIVHNLMEFEVQDYFSQIHLKKSAIVLCLESKDADLRILKNYAFYGIKDYNTYISTRFLPQKECYLKIAMINFSQVMETRAGFLSPEKREELKNYVKNHDCHLQDSELDDLIDALNTPFLYSIPKMILPQAIEMFSRAKWRDDCQYVSLKYEDWEQKNRASLYIFLAWRNTPKHNFIYRLARVIFRHHLVLKQLNASYINPYSTDSILLLSLSLHGENNCAAWEAADLADFLQELLSVKSFGSFDAVDETFVEPGLIRGNLGNLIRCMTNFIHQILVNVDPNLYSLENIEEGMCRHPELAVHICNAFEYKFHPERCDIEKFELIKKEFSRSINEIDTGHEENDIRRKNILRQGMNFVSYTLKSNFYRNNKSSLGFRLDPEYLNHAPFDRKKTFPLLPFGIFFIKGMHFLAYHIRFKDLSRGGLRTVFPQKKESMLVERNTVFNECYQLAYTQHKKNKDIPEGGSKAVIFLKPDEHLESEAQILKQEMERTDCGIEEIDCRLLEFKKEQKVEYLHQAQRSFIKTLLSLINCEPDGTLKVKNIIDYWKKPEYIYLGPDENLHYSMIEWIAATSTRYGYKPRGAFISGKPRIGINHKEYGVTSLGVNVYMHEVLEYLGINPSKEPFTVKMTGGPDGDVAGNQIYNLYRFYPKTARLIALTDVSGTIHDPHGLDLPSCVNLFKKGLPICRYPHEKLSEGAFLLDRNTKKEQSAYVQLTLCVRNKSGKIIEDWFSGNEMNAIYRNNVHQTAADIFIPCGGRPKTLNESNVEDFLDKTGQPTAKAIIEGANLYLSAWARRYLEEKGTLIIKDSSANKGGVICSSFEILCGLALTNEEFLDNKEALVEEILQIVQMHAKQEALLLLRTHRETGEYLTDLSDAVSEKINLFTDQLLEYLQNRSLKDPINSSFIVRFLEYCPKTLKEKFPQRLLSEIPDNHKKAIIASAIASQLVYVKGVHWLPGIIDILPSLQSLRPD